MFAPESMLVPKGSQPREKVTSPPIGGEQSTTTELLRVFDARPALVSGVACTTYVKPQVRLTSKRFSGTVLA